MTAAHSKVTATTTRKMASTPTSAPAWTLDDNWTLGLVAQNLLPRSIETKEVNGVSETFRIRPQVTTGVSWHNDMFTTALDVDLTPGQRLHIRQQTSVCRRWC